MTTAVLQYEDKIEYKNFKSSLMTHDDEEMPVFNIVRGPTSEDNITNLVALSPIFNKYYTSTSFKEIEEREKHGEKRFSKDEHNLVMFKAFQYQGISWDIASGDNYGPCTTVHFKYGTLINFHDNGIITIDQRYMPPGHGGILYSTIYTWNKETGEITYTYRNKL